MLFCEQHSRTGIRVITGGLKEFFWTKEDIQRIQRTDTPSTRDFKKALRLQNYFKDITNKKFELELRKYVKFYNVNFQVVNKKNKSVKRFYVQILYEVSENNFKEVLSYTCKESFNTMLPDTNYRFIISKMRFFIFPKKIILDITLNKNLKEKLVL